MEEIKNFNELIDNKQAKNRFSELANYLMKKCCLLVGTTTIELMEIEFYYKSNEHNDCNTHGDPNQLTSNGWYIHKWGTGYKSGNYKGLDITFGNGVDYGGILIRGIKIKNEYIAGPSKCVDKLMKLLCLEENDMTGFADAINEEHI